MRTAVVLLNVIGDFADIVESSSRIEDESPELMKELHYDVDEVVISVGFVRTRPTPDKIPSRRNGGWAYYDSYIIESDNLQIRLGINVRSADHPSKPNLKSKNKKRMDALEQELDTVDELEVIDTYYRERDWGAQYYIGKGDKYSDPVDSLDKLNTMLKGQLTKLIQKYL